MFYIFFGWRKASKCKNLIRKVQSRLKLLKNKRSCIVRQLREDIAILLKHGHQQTAFDRAEQLFKDECELAAYELLDNFCEFIIINFSYIRKFKDCPNDINEAVSTLIFASARFGDLPELKKIRDVFKDRYGKRFATIALELLPGNLVNQQIMDLRRICGQAVTDDVKFRLLSEIAGDYLKSGPLLIDYPAQSLHNLEVNHTVKRVWAREVLRWADECSEDQTRNGDIIITNTEAKNVCIGSSPEIKNFSKDYAVPESTLVPLPNRAASSISNENNQDEVKGGVYNGVPLIVESSSENSDASPGEMVYLDDIEEFVSSVRIEGNIQDQRVFMFSPSNCKTRHVNRESRGKLRKRSISLEKHCMIDAESAIYYNDSYETSNRKKHLKKRSKCKENEKCSQEYPCYLCKRQGLDLLIYQSVESLSPEEREQFIQDGFCTRALSMPSQQRWFKKDDNFMDNISRSMSSPIKQQGLLTSDHHIHPNLPDYDDLAAKFTSLKKTYLIENNTYACENLREHTFIGNLS